MLSLWPPTELAEGYQYETVRENYVLTDGNRSMQISYLHPNAHVEGMLVAYLPDEKLIIEADMVDGAMAGEPFSAQDTASARNFYNHVKRLNLEVETIAPIHGQVIPWDDFLANIGEN
jgi:hypothetical protein